MSDLDKYKDIINHQEVAGEDEFAQFLKGAANAKLPEGKGKSAIWDAIDQEIEEDEEKGTSSFNIWPVLGVAASIAMVISFFFFFTSEDTTSEQLSYATQNAEQKTVQLPDGSSVEVNTNSTLQFSEDWDRKVTLTGEAFFEVVKGSTFEVSTPSGTITVLGTSFNVYARSGNLEVACKTGKVQVTIPEKSFAAAIEPGEAISFRSDTVKREQYIPDLIGKWNEGEFYFNDKMLSEVLGELQRQFDIQVELADTIDQKFTGFFSSSDVETALEMICLPLDLSYEKVGDSNFVIRKNY